VLIGFSTWAFLVNPLNALASILPICALARGARARGALTGPRPAAFIVIGVFIFVVSFMGWYSSTRESQKLLGVVRGAEAPARAWVRRLRLGALSGSTCCCSCRASPSCCR
jgi:Zn-dependent protease with chaperone function